MSKKVIFSEPLKLANGNSITEVEITETMRQVGALRGLKLFDVMTSDVNSLITLLPRVIQRQHFQLILVKKGG
ncbi:hypothetical protein KKJ06_16940 [Xenorhabdus bovienii]|uniref:hypothetical protein n=1 Tax=Xenorhabdus bovienii TaxID=40576 RepID=UPI0023B3281C|nr:hypothetical protein [Xenorhabdus bovienii]MDE9552533.1 hypothetical protein [Xenorhabdus bovienii]MDE9557063.1 hypothetical protein [Xenorhabdus bovienii]